MSLSTVTLPPWNNCKMVSSYSLTSLKFLKLTYILMRFSLFAHPCYPSPAPHFRDLLFVCLFVCLFVTPARPLTSEISCLFVCLFVCYPSLASPQRSPVCCRPPVEGQRAGWTWSDRTPPQTCPAWSSGRRSVGAGPDHSAWGPLRGPPLAPRPPSCNTGGDTYIHVVH